MLPSRVPLAAFALASALVLARASVGCANDPFGAALDGGSDTSGDAEGLPLDGSQDGAHDDGPAGDDASAEGAPAFGGNVLIYSSSVSPKLAATILFYRNTGVPTNCVQSASSRCALVDCAPEAGADPSYKLVSAGLVTFAGDDGGASFSATPTEAGAYVPGAIGYTKDAGPEFVAGQTAFVAAAGDVAPAFGQKLAFPSLLAIVNPSVSTPSITVARSSDFTFTWKNGLPGTDMGAATSFNSNGHAVSLTCNADSTLGTMTIPSAFLGKLPPNAIISLFSMRTVTTTGSNFSVLSAFAGDVLSAGNTPVYLRVP